MLSDLLMWNKIGRIVTLLSERLDISGERALDIFYTSKTNERLHDPATLLYTFGDLYIVDEVMGQRIFRVGEARLFMSKEWRA
jgi:hypothetical protein